MTFNETTENNMTFNQILAKFRNESLTQSEKGTKFERLIKNWFRTDPRYKNDIEEIWLWEEFPYRKSIGTHDIGIDLVIKTKEQQYWAVQCKFYDDQTTIQKKDIDSFISCCGKTFFDENNNKQAFSVGYWVDTSLNSKWTKHAEEISTNQNNFQFHRISKQSLEESDVNWNLLLGGKYAQEARLAPKKLLDHQVEAIDAARKYFIEENHERGKLVMACGTGKTFTSLKMMESLLNSKGMVLFMVPSIALLGQSLNAWKSDAAQDFTAICICSDSKASREISDNKKANKGDLILDSVEDLAVPACTNVESIKKQMLKARNSNHEFIVVFSTYQSIDAVSQAQLEVLKDTNGEFGTFDFIVCDEAHRTTGVILSNQDESDFTKIHKNENVKAKKRLYMTATPRLYGENAKNKASLKNLILCSMDDESIYGEEFYRVGFAYAVHHGLLTDYKVMVLTVSESDSPNNVHDNIENSDLKEYQMDDTLKLIGVINALSKRILGEQNKIYEADPCLMKRAVAFCKEIGETNKPGSSKNVEVLFPAICELYKNNLSEDERKKVVDIKVQHIDGSMNSSERGDKLSWIKEEAENPNECRILTNVRCLSEGIDVPSLDAVIFLSSRNSQVDVVQSVGRVMRNFHKGQPDEKKYGYIIIPIVVPNLVSPAEALNNNEKFKVVWDILNALRAHDERFNAEVNSFALNKSHEDSNIVIAKPGFPYSIGSSAIGNETNAEDHVYDAVEVSNERVGIQLSIQFEELQNSIYARLVEKCGDRFYWETWAGKVGKIAQDFIERITNMIHEGRDLEKFDTFLNELRDEINPSISKEDAIEMLAQHMIVGPVFDVLFEDYHFVSNNSVSKSMQEMLELLMSKGFEKDRAELQKFYDNVKLNVRKIDNLEGKQTIIKTLYEKFFKIAFPKVTSQLGIVYTPIECVDFIIHSVEDLLQKEFNTSLTNQNVQILDPFVGTGSFIVRLLQSGLIKKEDLKRKYLHEIFCNEIVLLAYYVADVNIEYTYHALCSDDEYLPYDGISLTDTFQLNEQKQRDIFSVLLNEQDENIKLSNNTIRVIIGNPPYSVGQDSANDNAQNQTYEHLKKRISETYAKNSKVTLKNSLYDSYIKAIRWASDRIEDQNNKEGGIVAFITNGGWLDGNAMDGMRKCLEEEFSSIYVFNLRGNQRTKGEESKKEGGKIFGSGSRAPIAITFLVKNPKKQGKAKIYYYDIGDYLSREEKLNKVKDFVSIDKVPCKEIAPNAKYDWINQRGDKFDKLIILGDKKDKDPNKQTIFEDIYSGGLSTGRDVWCYNSSKQELINNINRSIDFYNQTVDEFKLTFDENFSKVNQKEIKSKVLEFLTQNNKFDSTKYAWTRSQIETYLPSFRKHCFLKASIYESSYRPYFKQQCYFNTTLNEMVLQQSKHFPIPKSENIVICTAGKSDKYFSCIVTSVISDLHYVGTSQCFPLYWYEKKEDYEKRIKGDKKETYDLFDGIDVQKVEKTYKNEVKLSTGSYIKHSGITDWALSEFRKRLNSNSITKEQIFYYVYGLLHSKDYRKEFEAELKKSLARLPIVDTIDDFIAFYKAGKTLAELHLNYESIPANKDVVVKTVRELDNQSYDDFRVIKMKFPSKDQKSTIIYNSLIIIENIPEVAYEYQINGKSAIEWIMERYQVTQDKDTLIKNDPNNWAIEHEKPRYILDLLLSVIEVSVRTVEIVNNLPKLEF